jgi:uncharacterized protein (DUF952 family)
MSTSPEPVLRPEVPLFAWRVFTPDEWQAAVDAGAFSGTALDRKDGYIHLSLPEEVRKTVTTYFSSAPALILAKISIASFTAAGMTRMDWVASRSAYFPHVFREATGTETPSPPSIPMASFVQPIIELTNTGHGFFSGWPEDM